MRFNVLESTDFKDKYFYRTEKWDWLTREMIHVFDSKSPRVITMDYWPQRVFLEADGQRTVAEFIYFIASKYPKTQIPRNLDVALIEELTKLIKEEKLIALSDKPVILDSSVLQPLTEEGEINMFGIWKGTYSYNLHEDLKNEKTKEVEFTIKVNNVLDRNRFEGLVEDNLKTGGTPGVGTIKGGFSDDDIFFEKKMPVYARLERDGSHTINENKKHPTIIYEGEFSRNKQFISGTWRFKNKVLVWKGIVPFWIIPGQGKFRMEKIAG